jgi:hypothetical protein
LRLIVPKVAAEALVGEVDLDVEGKPRLDDSLEDPDCVSLVGERVGAKAHGVLRVLVGGDRPRVFAPVIGALIILKLEAVPTDRAPFVVENCVKEVRACVGGRPECALLAVTLPLLDGVAYVPTLFDNAFELVFDVGFTRSPDPLDVLL